MNDHLYPADLLKKWRPCLGHGCKRMLWTDRRHRLCPKCTAARCNPQGGGLPPASRLWACRVHTERPYRPDLSDFEAP